jgi:hypothetical protein
MKIKEKQIKIKNFKQIFPINLNNDAISLIDFFNIFFVFGIIDIILLFLISFKL